jgi:urease accessory protein
MKLSSDLRLVRLLQLVSPTLPVGAYSYSQGLESAIEAGIVHDAADTEEWIGAVLEYSVERMEAPSLLRLIKSWGARDEAAVARWNDLFLASRETAELRAETLQMGYSLKTLLMELEGQDEKACAPLDCLEEMAFPTAFAFAVAQWHLPAQPALVAYLWAWLESQVMAAIKLVPLGQTDGQRILLALGERLSAVSERAAAIADDELGSFAPALAIFSSRHETQYSRLFRS